MMNRIEVEFIYFRQITAVAGSTVNQIIYDDFFCN